MASKAKQTALSGLDRSKKKAINQMKYVLEHPNLDPTDLPRNQYGRLAVDDDLGKRVTNPGGLTPISQSNETAQADSHENEFEHMLNAALVRLNELAQRTTAQVSHIGDLIAGRDGDQAPDNLSVSKNSGIEGTASVSKQDKVPR
jgi:hypothetical protein